jgi:hypothetical protein
MTNLKNIIKPRMDTDETRIGDNQFQNRLDIARVNGTYCAKRDSICVHPCLSVARR